MKKTPQQQLFDEIQQIKLKPRLIELLEEGLTRATIEACLKEFKDGTGIKETKAKPDVSRALRYARY